MHTIRLMRAGEIREIQAAEGSLLSDVLAAAGIYVSMPCAGSGGCGKCLVRAEGNLFPPPDAKGMCLACQTIICGCASVWIGEAVQLQGIEGVGNLPEFRLDPLPGKYGLAVDIGTTTLAVQLVSLQDGRLMQAVTAENPQRRISHDVIGRIQASLDGRGEQLKKLVEDEISRMTQQLCRDAGIPEDEISQRVIAGNTAMLYLLTGRNPASIAAAPFEADCLFDLQADGCYLPPCMGAYVGADIACALLDSDMVRRHKTAMLIDIGTNGEICLLHQGRLYCCATAAGPAFEGVGISCGVSSIRGAIENAWVRDGEIVLRTIGDEAPVGICGSGLIDIAAALLDLEWLDETGYLECGQVQLTGNVTLTQKDIRMLQLAKGSICAGMRTLLSMAKIDAKDVEKLYIAGGFGRHINIVSALRIGLITEIEPEKVQAIGNAALAGAIMLLLSRDAQDHVRRLADQAECINLASMPQFQQYYIDDMIFPET